MFPVVDANDALDQLLQVSEDVRAAVVFERGGELIAGTLLDEEARELAGLGDAMLAYADTLRDAASARRVEAVTPDGGVYVAQDGELAVAAVAAPGALAALVQHDLRTLLGNVSRPRRRTKTHALS
jgi:hypothetical protein